jgi:hypothetical protein
VSFAVSAVRKLAARIVKSEISEKNKKKNSAGFAVSAVRFLEVISSWWDRRFWSRGR